MNTQSVCEIVTYVTQSGETKQGTVCIIVAIPDDMSDTSPVTECFHEVLSKLSSDQKCKADHHYMETHAVLNYKQESRTLESPKLLRDGKISTINDRLLRCNVIDLSGKDLTEHNILWNNDNINLSTIRKLNLSDTKNTNDFLKAFFSHSKSIKSLDCIDIAHTDVRIATFDLWRQRNAENFDGPLIRSRDKISCQKGGCHVAELCIQNIMETPVFQETSIKEKMEIQRPSETRFEILYKDEGFLQLGYAYLQIILN